MGLSNVFWGISSDSCNLFAANYSFSSSTPKPCILKLVGERDDTIKTKYFHCFS